MCNKINNIKGHYILNAQGYIKYNLKRYIIKSNVQKSCLMYFKKYCKILSSIIPYFNTYH